MLITSFSYLCFTFIKQRSEVSGAVSVGIDGAEDYDEKSTTLEAMCRSETIKYSLCQEGGRGMGGVGIVRDGNMKEIKENSTKGPLF